MDGSLRVGDEVEVLPGSAAVPRSGPPDARPEGRDRRARTADGSEPREPRRRSAQSRHGRNGTRLAEAGDDGRRSPARCSLHRTTDPAQPLGDVPHRRCRGRSASCCCSTANACNRARRRWAQIRLPEPVATVKGDRFVIRDPNDTLGGGVIVDTNARRHRRHHAPTIAALEALEKGSPEELVLIAIGQLQPIDQEKLSQTVQLDANAVERTLETLIRQGSVVALEMGPVGRSGLYTTQGIDALGDRILSSR